MQGSAAGEMIRWNIHQETRMSRNRLDAIALTLIFATGALCYLQPAEVAMVMGAAAALTWGLGRQRGNPL